MDISALNEDAKHLPIWMWNSSFLAPVMDDKNAA